MYILNNLSEIDPYLTRHKYLIKVQYPRMNEKWFLTEHNRTFKDWFKESISNESGASDICKWLSCFPKFNVITWSAYDISKYSFYIKSKGDQSTMQNSGVMVEVESM